MILIVEKNPFTMPLRINSRQITTSLSPYERRAQIANLV
jgi:hypothetical protein